jgi:hypothetical protein
VETFEELCVGQAFSGFEHSLHSGLFRFLKHSTGDSDLTIAGLGGAAAVLR